MYESMLNFPGSMFIEFDRLRRDLDDLFGAPSPPSSIPLMIIVCCINHAL